MFSIDELEDDISSLHTPFIVDTEYDSFLQNKIEQRNRTKLCLQVKGIDISAKPFIFVNENLKTVINSHRIGPKTNPFYPLKSEFFAIDYLNRNGVEAYIKPVKLKTKVLENLIFCNLYWSLFNR